jgi:DNA-binding transcriptional LysR family regulator
MGSREQVAALREREIDVGFVRMPVEAEGLRVRPVMEERLEMVSSEGGGKSLRDWAEEPFVMLSRGTSASYYDHVLALCREAGFAPRIVQEANQLYTVLNLVRAGVGVSLAPTSARLMRVPGIRFRASGVSGADWQIGMAWREEKNTAVERFVAMVRREMKV